jgi:hypothetical protein
MFNPVVSGLSIPALTCFLDTSLLLTGAEHRSTLSQHVSAGCYLGFLWMRLIVSPFGTRPLGHGALE